MPEITLNAIEQLLDSKLGPIKTGMARLATQESVDDLAKTVAQVQTTVNGHTTALDQLLTKKQRKEDDAIVSAARFERLEHWAQQVGQQLGIKLDL